ncbi:hypothetical protein BDV93DRAFT_564965 [Ceratobasidium sp. AG-I]|nr:hypothetical protein BDV93DRAFT_564965 [Ceratobasidium sp. AG-I]
MLFALPVALSAIAAYFQVMFMQYHGWQPGTKPLLWNAIEDWRRVTRRRGAQPGARRLISVWMKLIAASELKPPAPQKIGSMAHTCLATVVWLKHPIELKEQHVVVNPYTPSSTVDDELPLSSDDIFVYNLVFCGVMAVYVLIMLVVFTIHFRRRTSSTRGECPIPVSLSVGHSHAPETELELADVSNAAAVNPSADSSEAIHAINTSGSSSALCEPTSSSTSLSSLQFSTEADLSESCRIATPPPPAQKTSVKKQPEATLASTRSESTTTKVSASNQRLTPPVEPPVTASVETEPPLDTSPSSEPTTGNTLEPLEKELLTEPAHSRSPDPVKTEGCLMDSPTSESSPPSSFPAFEPSASLIRSTLQASEAFQGSRVDSKGLGVQSSTGSLFSNSGGSCDMDISNGPEEDARIEVIIGEVTYRDSDGARLPPLDLDFVLQCGTSSPDAVSDSCLAKVNEPKKYPPSPGSLGSSIWAYKIPPKPSEVPNPVALPFMPDYKMTADYATDRIFATQLFASRQASVTEKEGKIVYASLPTSYSTPKPLRPPMPSGSLNALGPGLLRYPSLPGPPVKPAQHLSPSVPPPAVVPSGKRGAGTQNSMWAKGPTPRPIGFTSRGRRGGGKRGAAT